MISKKFQSLVILVENQLKLELVAKEGKLDQQLEGLPTLHISDANRSDLLQVFQVFLSFSGHGIFKFSRSKFMIAKVLLSFCQYFPKFANFPNW
jgi:hypothetical protein